jgi:anti-repressor protein
MEIPYVDQLDIEKHIETLFSLIDDENETRLLKPIEDKKTLIPIIQENNTFNVNPKDIITYKHDNFGQCRIMFDINNNPWWAAVDVCRSLKIKNSRDSVSNLDESEKGVGITDTLGGRQNITIINEFGLFTLILRSRKPEAKEFKKWIIYEILPSIRKTGSYNIVKNDIKQSDDEIILQGYTILQKRISEFKNIIEEQTKLIEENKPKVQLANNISESDDLILINTLSKLIRQNRYDIGEKRLFIWLRENNYLCSEGKKYNQPTQKSLELGVLKLIERTILDGKKRKKQVFTPMVTGKGQIYFMDRVTKDINNM